MSDILQFKCLVCGRFYYASASPIDFQSLEALPFNPYAIICPLHLIGFSQ